MTCSALSFACIFWSGSTLAGLPAPPPGSTLPQVQAMAVDGHEVRLPRDLSARTVVIAGFTRASAKQTTAWEVPVRTHLADERVGFFDVAVLDGVPGMLQGFVRRSLRKQVPPVLQGRFLPLFADGGAWKTLCGFSKASPDAACVLVTDGGGHVLSRTSEPYSEEAFARLTRTVRAAATNGQ